MGERTGNATWADGTGGGTLITAATLNAVETALDATIGPYQRPKVNSFLGPYGNEGNGSSADALATGAQYPARLIVPKRMTVDQIGFNVDTAEAVNAKAWLYASDIDGFPTTLAVDSGALSCATTGNKIATITPVVLAAGIYWGFIRSNSGTTVRFRCHAQLPTAAVDSTFNNLTSSYSTIQADPGTYASPATVSSWTYAQGITTAVHPTMILRRSA